MAEIRTYPIISHLRAEPSQAVLHFRGGRLVRHGRGLALWFRPLVSSITEVPIDDRELPFLFHARSRDFQEAIVQGAITYRVADAVRLAERVDFTIDLRTGLHRHAPLERLAGLLTDLSQQFAMDYLVHTDLETILVDGVETIRSRIDEGLRTDDGLREMGLAIVAVRVSAIRPEADVERALRVRVREAIQQQADEATFRRRALAVEKERAIAENELQNRIELARREEQLIAQDGDNERRRVTDRNAAEQIAAAGLADRVAIEANAEAERVRLVETAHVEAERDRMAIYRDFPADRLLGLAAQGLAGKLEKIEHLNITPELIGPMLTNLIGAGTRRLENERSD